MSNSQKDGVACTNTNGPVPWDAELRKMEEELREKLRQNKARREALDRKLARMKKDVATLQEDIRKEDEEFEKMHAKRSARFNAQVDAVERMISRAQTKWAIVLAALLANERSASSDCGMQGNIRRSNSSSRRSQHRSESLSSDRRGSSHDLQ
ncbi:MAG: hypothetical protein SGILL_006184 [Bacillariaceae sp.]